MNNARKWLIILLIISAFSGSCIAQIAESQEDSPWSVGADLMSRYVWRGLNLGGSSPSIQPGLEYSFGSADHAFAIGAWGAYSLSGTQTGQEADLYLTYTLKDLLSFTVTDYFFPDETSARYQYFNYNMDQTGHLVEAAIGFNGTEKIPVSLLFAMNIWGADAQKYKEEAGVMLPQNGIVMSKYVELGYSTEIKGVALDVFAGMCLDAPDTAKGEPSGFYGQESAALINLGFSLSKEIRISDSYSLPVSGSLVCNPEAGNVFIVFGISF